MKKNLGAENESIYGQEDLLLEELSVNSFINQNPLTVSSDTSLVEVLISINNNFPVSTATTFQKDCVLVTENNRLLGLLTKRDIVRLTAEKRDFKLTKVREVMSRKIITIQEKEVTDIFIPLGILRQFNIRHLPVINEEQKIVGLITSETIRQVLQPSDFFKIRQNKDIMTSEVICATPETSLFKIAQLMSENKISCVIIIKKSALNSDQKIPLGIITERDIVQYKTLELNLDEVTAKTVMSSPLFTLTPEQYLWQTQKQMNHRNINHLVVCSQEGFLQGIITKTNILRSLDPVELTSIINLLQEKIKDLETENKKLINSCINETFEKQSKETINILLIEDSRPEAKIITQILQKKNIFLSQLSVNHFINLSTGLQELHINKNYDVIILDLNLPDSEGLSTLLTVKKYCGNIPVIVLTSGIENDIDFALECLHQGAQDYLFKGDYLSNLGQNKDLLIRSIYYAIERKNIEKKLQKQSYKLSATNRKLKEQLNQKVTIQKGLNDLTKQLELQVEARLTNLKDVLGQLQNEIQKRQKIEKVLRDIVQGFYHSKGVNFYHSLVKYIAQCLEIEYVIIGELIKNNKIKTIAHYGNGQIINNLEYNLSGTPCEKIIKTKKLSFYEKNIQTIFPDDLILKNMQAESYLGIPLLDSKGKILGLVATIGREIFEKDIALQKEILQLFATIISTELEREKIQKSLQDKTRLLNKVINTANEGITLSNLHGKLLIYNTAMTEITGYSRTDLNNNFNYISSFSPDETDTIHPIFNEIKSADKKTIKNLETTIKTKSGIEKTLLISSSLIKLGNEEFIFSIYRDISERIQYENALKNINQELEIRVEKRTTELQATTSRLTVLMENSGHGVLIQDEKGVVILINQVFCNIFEIDDHPFTLIGSDLANFAEDYQEYFTDKFRQDYNLIFHPEQPLINQEIPFEDGRIFEMDYIPIFINDNYSGNLWMFRNVTQRKTFELNLENLAHELQYKNQQLSDFKAALDQAAIVAITDPSAKITYVNDNFCNISLYEREELIGENHRIVNSGYHSREFWQEFWHTISQGNIWRGEVKNKRKDGSFYWVDTVIIPFLDHNNKPWQYMGIRYDITEKKEAENTLKENFAVIEAAIDGIAILKQDKYTYLNQSHLSIFGYEKSSELVGKSWRNLYDQKEIQRFEREVFPILGQEKHWQGEVVGRKKNGEIVVEDLSLTLMDDNTLICVCRDITEKKVKETNFQMIFEQVSLGIVIVNLEGKFIQFNHTFAEIFGYSREELEGKTVFDLVYPDNIKSVKNDIQSFLNGTINSISENRRFSHKNGSLILAHLRVSLVNSPLGEPDYFIAILEDVTEKKQTESELNRYFDMTLDLISISNFEGKFKRLNPAWENLLGYSLKELMSQSLFNFVHPDDQEKTTQIFAKLTTSENTYKVKDFENRYLCKNGEYKWLSWSSISVPEEKLIYGIARDITERKNTEIALKTSLEKEQELNELKSRFLSITSHEFRTPLTVIGSSVGILKSFAHKLSEEQKNQHLETIQTYIKHTTNLLDDILLINHVDTGKLTLNISEFDLVKFCEKIIDEVKVTLNNTRQIHLTSKNEVLGSLGQYYAVNMDEKILRQIFLNILSNAIKYSPKESTIYLNLILQNKEVIFTIQDSGIGIPLEDQKHLFDFFHRAQNVGTIQGTGLGLSIVKKCVELHGGNITFQSEVNKGTTFIVRLPR